MMPGEILLIAPDYSPKQSQRRGRSPQDSDFLQRAFRRRRKSPQSPAASSDRAAYHPRRPKTSGVGQAEKE